MPRNRERLEERSDGLIVVRYEMTDEQRKQRRADNKLAKRSHQMHRKRKKHGKS